MPAFSLDAVAARAGVARAITQQQFGSAAGVLEALWDDLLSRGCLEQLPQAFANPDAATTLAELIAIYGRFWHRERGVIRRVRAFAAFDREREQALLTRDRARREGLQNLARRLAQGSRSPKLPASFTALDLLAALTAFETFDLLAVADRGIEDVIGLLQALSRTYADGADTDAGKSA
jgi:AcrR family transcriptional regulator